MVSNSVPTYCNNFVCQDRRMRCPVQGNEHALCGNSLVHGSSNRLASSRIDHPSSFCPLRQNCSLIAELCLGLTFAFRFTMMSSSHRAAGLQLPFGTADRSSGSQVAGNQVAALRSHFMRMGQAPAGYDRPQSQPSY